MLKQTFDQIRILDVGNLIVLAGIVLYEDQKDTTYFCVFPDKKLGKPILLELDLDDWKKMIKQMDVLETEIIKQGPDGIVKAILRKSQRQIDGHVMWKVYKRDEYKCRYCGRDYGPFSVDHLILWEEGGPTIEDNLVTACKKCNRMRGSTPYKEWLEHDYYKKVSKKLSPEVINLNIDTVKLLASIPRVKHVRSR